MNAHRRQAAIRRRRQTITTVLFVAGGILVVAALFLLITGNSSAINVRPVQTGKALDNFGLTDINGKTVHLGDYAGKVVLVNAWATWCPPCKAEMPYLNAYYQAHQNDGFVILAVNAGDPASDAAGFAGKNGLAFPVLLDPNTRLLSALGIQSFPTSILVGKDGVVKSIHLGMYTPETLEAEITPFLQ